MNGRWRYLDAHVLFAGPVETLSALERDHPVRCIACKTTPRHAFIPLRGARTSRWARVPIPPFPIPPSGWTLQSYVVEPDDLPPRDLLRRVLRARSPLDAPLLGSLDYEARGQVDGVHGSPTPDQAIRMPDATEAEFRTQVAFERIGLLRMERALHRPRGSGVTVVILDSAPDLYRDEPAFDAGLVDVYVEWPHRLPENLAALRPLEEAEEEGCGLTERRRYRVSSSLVARADEMAQYRAHHGVMIASLVRRIAPETNIVLVRLLNGSLGTLTGDLIEAMRWVRHLRRVPHPSGPCPLVYGSLVYNLSLGVDRSQPETVQSCVLLWAADEAARSGAVLVCAAGNLSEGRPENCLEPAAYGHFGDTLSTRTQVIPVAASSYASPERYAWFSNEAHFAAPGEDLILDCGAEVAGARYVRWSGTSFSSALVTGIVALYLSAGLPPHEAKQRLWEDARHPRSWGGVHLVQAGV